MKSTLYFSIVVFIVFVVSSCGNQRGQSSFPEDIDTAQVDTVEVLQEKSKATWNFNIKKDEMTDSKNIWASIESANYISQDFPYEGNTYASIIIRHMKQYGYDVIVQISKGQIHGSEYDGTDYITARFDEGTPKRYYFDKASDGSSELVFIRNKTEFIKHCKQTKDIKIDIPIYKAGRPVFSFHVDEPLIWREE